LAASKLESIAKRMLETAPTCLERDAWDCSNSRIACHRKPWERTHMVAQSKASKDTHGPQRGRLTCWRKCHWPNARSKTSPTHAHDGACQTFPTKTGHTRRSWEEACQHNAQQTSHLSTSVLSHTWSDRDPATMHVRVLRECAMSFAHESSLATMMEEHQQTMANTATMALQRLHSCSLPTREGQQATPAGTCRNGRNSSYVPSWTWWWLLRIIPVPIADCRVPVAPKPPQLAPVASHS